jgi:TetR/AcrR family transcriptional regulator
VRSADDAALAPRARLEALAVALIEAYRDTDAEHQVQIAELKKLPAPQQASLKALERDLVRRFSDAIAAARPGLDPSLLKPVTMSLFGMLNWHYLWFRPDGPMSRADYARLAVGLVVEGSGDHAGRD